MKKQFCITVLSCITAFYSFSVFAQSNKTTVKKAWSEFSRPEDSTRTKVWWFHGDTETTREGITADLEAFKQAGVGGVVYYDQVYGKGKNALPGFSKEWWRMFKFAASEAKRLGLSFETNVSNGYVAGGPWITEEFGMQRLTASDTLVKGGRKFTGTLAIPPRRKNAGYYSDVAVLAFPAPAGKWESNQSRHPQLSSNIPQLNVAGIFRPNSNELISISPQKKGSSVYLNLDFKGLFSARSITYQMRPRSKKATTGAMNVPGPPADDFYGVNYQTIPDLGQLEVSDDGINYHKVCDLKPIYKAASATWNQKTISFPKVQGRYFRLNLHDWTYAGDPGPELMLGNVLISAQARVDQWEEKAGLYSEYIDKDKTPDYSSQDIIDPAQIIDLTSKMNKEGKLEWNVPKGQWVIMRFAHVPTGGHVSHGRSNQLGLECDKMSAVATKLQWNNYFKVMLDTLTAAKLPLKGMIMDSNEAGSQNWTPGFEQQFTKRRGYDIHTYLPALMGYIVGSKQKTVGFLYDMRRTIADMVSDEYFGTFDHLCREAGVNFTAQATGNGLSLAADNIQAKGRVEKPQGEFWADHTHGSYDIKETSSAAHIYGKKIASAEAFTGVKYSHSLATMKNLADYAYAFGINEFAVCTSPYQPWLDKIPGNTMNGWEYSLNRNNTYWKYSRPFWDYQARCAGLMRQGIPVVDLCIYLGSNPPVKLLTYRLPEIPEGYDFDVCTADALTNRMTAKEGIIFLPDGMSYQMLVLEKKADITLDALRHIASLVKEGVPVHGLRPIRSESLHDNTNEKEYTELIDQLWGTETATSGSHTFGKGNVYWGMSLAEALSKEGIRPDMGVKSGNIPTDRIYFAHRNLADADVYFINNHSNRIFNDSIRLRINATNAEYWDPMTGMRNTLSASKSGTDGLNVNVVLQPNESGFIVTSNQLTTSLQPKLIGLNDKVEPIEGSWNVYFDPKWGGPGDVVFNSLIDWTKHTDAGIRYYSGTAVYRKTISINNPTSGEQVLLRFPNLGSIALVFINGTAVSTVWCSPWEADITSYIQKGNNAVEIQVVNSLNNRMVGDASLPESKRFTFAFPAITTPKTSLLPSGILDKVLLVKRSK